jgi:hypothetical protein
MTFGHPRRRSNAWSASLPFAGEATLASNGVVENAV